jgi:colanic acid/amylovoran biosynthesis glycosyltransferase
MTIKVIHSCPVWLPHTQIWLYNQICCLPNEIENHIVCEKKENLARFSLPNIHSLSDSPKFRSFWDRSLRKLRFRPYLGFLVDVGRRENPTILHSHFGHNGWANLDAAKQLGLFHVLTFYGYDVNQLPKIDPRWFKRYKKLFANVDQVLCEGSYMAQCITELGCPANKVEVHHLGVNTWEIDFNPRVWKPDEPLRVLIAASFREKKGIPFALEALGRLQHQVPLEVTLIGDANQEARSQREKKTILATIEKHNLQSKVRLLGYQPYAVFFEEAYRHHIFLSPSIIASDGDTEGGAPVSLIDIAATGMPIVSTKHCDIPEVIKDGVTGLLAHERDVDGLVSHLQWLVAHPEEWHGMVLSARKHVETDYDAQIQGKKLAEIYSKLG